MPVGHKLTLLIWIASSVVLLSAAGAVTVYDWYSSRNAMARNLGIQADIASANVSAAVVFDDAAGADEVLSTFGQDPRIVSGSVFNQDRELLSRFVQPDAEVVHHLDEELRTIARNATLFTHGGLAVSRRIVHNGESVGHVVIVCDTSSLYARLKNFLIVVLAVVCIGSLFAFGLSAWVQRAVSHPISALAMLASRVTNEHDYSLRAECLTNDEIGSLGSSINKMLSAVEERDMRLEESRANLSNDVARQTRELRQMNAHLEDARLRAEAASRSKSEFLANMSHELRTPLHGILSFAEFGCKRLSTATQEKLGQYFEHIRSSGTTLLALVNELLDLAKLESGRMTFDFRVVEVPALVSSVVEECRPLSSARGLSVDCAFGSGECSAHVDPVRVKQVLRNLLSNAIRFAPEGTAVDVTVDPRGSDLFIAVEDRGPGVPEPELETVFDQFVQSSATKSNAGGTGLGLAICRHIVSAHGGEIWAEQREGGGARFCVRVPRKEAGRTAA